MGRTGSLREALTIQLRPEKEDKQNPRAWETNLRLEKRVTGRVKIWQRSLAGVTNRRTTCGTRIGRQLNAHLRITTRTRDLKRTLTHAFAEAFALGFRGGFQVEAAAASGSASSAGGSLPRLAILVSRKSRSLR